MTARAWLLFAAVGIVWGLPYLFIKIAVAEVSPAFVAWSRIALGGLVLLPFAWRSGALRGLGARWKAITAFAFFEVVIPFPLIAFGEQRVSSSLAAILVASLPLVIAVLAIRVDSAERVTGVRLFGILVGLTGVVTLLGIDVAGRPGEALGAAAILVATVGYAIGPLIVKRHFSDIKPLGPITAAFGVAAVMLLPAVLAAPPRLPLSPPTLVSLAVLGIVCSALAFLLYFSLIGAVGPSRASVITYVNPAVAVALGILVLGEELTGGAVAGLLLISAGCWLSSNDRLPPGLALLAPARGPSGAPS